MAKRILFAHHQVEATALFACLAREAGYEVELVCDDAKLEKIVNTDLPDLFLLDVPSPFGETMKIARRVFNGESVPELGDPPLLILDYHDSLKGREFTESISQGNILGCMKPQISVNSFLEKLVLALGPSSADESSLCLAFKLGNLNIAKLILAGFNSKFTGQVTFTNNEISKTIYFEDGIVTSASSNLSLDRIGNLLISKGLIDENQINKALIAANDSGSLIGKELVSRGWINEKDLTQGLLEQSEMIILSIFDWEEFEISFSVKVENRPPKVMLQIKPFWLAKRGIDRIFNKRSVKELLPLPSWFVLPNHVNAMNLSFMRFSKEEKEFLSMINGQTAIGSLIENSPFNFEKSRSFITSLILTDLIIPSEVPLDRASPFVGLPLDEQKNTPFSEAFFYKDDTIRNPNSSPLITNEELHAELKKLDEDNQDQSESWTFINDENTSDVADIADIEMKGLRVRTSNPIKYLMIVGLLLIALFLLTINFILKSSPPSNFSNRTNVNGPVEDLYPVSTLAMDHYITGMELLESPEPKALEGARKSFMFALEIDPDYQPAMDALQKVELMLNKAEGVPPLLNKTDLQKTPTSSK